MVGQIPGVSCNGYQPERHSTGDRVQVFRHLIMTMDGPFKVNGHYNLQRAQQIQWWPANNHLGLMSVQFDIGFDGVGLMESIVHCHSFHKTMMTLIFYLATHGGRYGLVN